MDQPGPSSPLASRDLAQAAAVDESDVDAQRAQVDLAQRNYTSSDGMIEARRGWANTISTKQDYREITEGLGTRSYLHQNASPIRGVAILSGADPDLVDLSMRLPVPLSSLGPTITQQVEREASQPLK